MDAVTMYLEAANCLLDDYVEVSYFSEVFEGGDEKIQDTMKNNAEIEEKSVSLLQKALNAIKSIIKKIRGLIDDMMSYFKADSDTKSQYQKFCEEVKNNPEFAKKKVSFKEYSKIAKQWNEELAKEEAQYRKIKDDELENKPSIAQDLHNAWDTARGKIMSTGKIVAKEVAVEYLVQEAKTCRDGALSARSKLENELGKKEARKVKRKLKMLSSKCSLVRKLAGGVETEYLTWKDALKNVFSASGISNIIIRNKDLRKDVGGTAASATATVAHIGVKSPINGAENARYTAKTPKKYEKKHGKQIENLKKVMNDDKLRDDQKRTYIRRQREKIPKFEED